MNATTALRNAGLNVVKVETLPRFTVYVINVEVDTDLFSVIIPAIQTLDISGILEPTTDDTVYTYKIMN